MARNGLLITDFEKTAGVIPELVAMGDDFLERYPVPCHEYEAVEECLDALPGRRGNKVWYTTYPEGPRSGFASPSEIIELLFVLFDKYRKERLISQDSLPVNVKDFNNFHPVDLYFAIFHPKKLEDNDGWGLKLPEQSWKLQTAIPKVVTPPASELRRSVRPTKKVAPEEAASSREDYSERLKFDSMSS